MTQQRTRNPGPEGLSRTLPPRIATALEQWILAQDDPFSPDDVARETEGLLGAPLTASALEGFLHDCLSVSNSPEGFLTPRILARRFRFLLRLLPAEREQGYLIPGHRFLPFMPLDADPDDLVLVVRDGTRLKRVTVEVDKEVAESCVALLGHKGALGFRPTKQARGRVLVNAFKLEGPLFGAAAAPEVLVVQCLEFETRLYRLEARTGTTDPKADAELRRLVRALGTVVTSPPRGPIDSRRQLLQTVARSLRDLDGKPLPALSSLAAMAPELYLAQDGSECRFASRNGGGRGQRNGAARAERQEELDRVVEALERAHRVLPRGLVGRGTDFRLQIAGFHWNPKELCFRGAIQGNAEAPYQLHLAVNVERKQVDSGCTCPLSKGYSPCAHLAAALQELIHVLRLPNHPLAEEVRRGTALPPWKHALLRLDGLLQSTAQQTAATEAVRSRLTWRITETAESFTVTPYLQKARKPAAWSVGQKVALARIASGEENWVQPADQEIAKALIPLVPFGWNAPSYAAPAPGADAFEVALRLIDHPHVSWESGPLSTVAVERGELGLRLEAAPGGGMALRVLAGGRATGAPAKCYLCRHGLILLDRAADRVVVARAERRPLALATDLLAHEAVFPQEAAGDVLSRIPALESVLPVDLPAELIDQEVEADARLHMLLTPERPSGMSIAFRQRPMPGGRTLFAPGAGPGVVSEFAGGRKRLARRELQGEIDRAAAVADSLQLRRWPEEEPWLWRVPQDDDALDLVFTLQERPREDVQVEWPEDGRRMFLLGEAGAGSLKVRIEDRRDWFGLQGRIEVDGESVTLAQVLDSLREGRRYVPVGEGKFLKISKLLQERLAGLADVVHAGRNELEFSATAVPMIEEFLADAGEVEASEGWHTLVARFERSLAFSPDPPDSFHGSLRGYQLDGYRWMQRLAAWGVGGCLADDMGLGKTVQALAVLAERAVNGPALVIAPTSVGSNWIEECKRFSPHLHPILYRETDRDTILDEFSAGDLVVISYGLVLRDIEKLSAVPWNTLILDEAQFIKNSRTKTAQAIRGLEAEWRLALTGTPIENHLGELWSLFRAVCPGLFGSWDRFREQFALPIERDKLSSRRRALARVVRPFILRRTKGEVLAELPPRTEVRLSAELSPEERKLYDDARLGAIVRLTQPAEDGKDKRFQVLAALTELRQLACHPRLIHPGTDAESAKLRVFLETIEELREGGHRALVFSQFTRYLALVREALDARKITYQYLDGSTPPKVRDKVVEAFQKGEGDLFLISLKAGGTGLNLTAADYVIHLDPWWNPAVEDQATDRAHRIGQSRPVMVYRIVATETIEEQILALHGEKRSLVADVLDGTDVAGKLSTEELIDLIKSGVAPAAAGAEEAH